MRAESLARSGAVSLAGSAVAALAALALTVVLGNGAGPEGTGLFFQAIGVFTVLTQSLKLGTNSTIIRSVAAQRARGVHGELWPLTVIAVVPVLLASAVTGVLVWWLADSLASVLGGGSELTGVLRSLAPYLVIAAVMGVLQTLTRMVNGVVAFSLLQNVLLPVARLAAVLTALLLGLTATQAVSAWLAPIPAVLLITVLLLIRPLRRDARDRRAEPGDRPGTRAAAGEFWRFSSARGVGAMLETAYEWADVLLVAALASPAAAGVYAVVTRAVRAGQIVDRAMRIAVSPRISALLALGEREQARDLHTSVTRVMVLATWPYYLTLAALGPAVLAVFGDGFGDGALALAVISGTVMVSAAAGMLQSILLQGGHSSWQMGNKALALALLVTLNLVLVPPLGLAGAALAWLVSTLVDIVLAAVQVHRGMGVHLQPQKLLLSAALPLLVYGGGGLALRPLVGESPLLALAAVVALSVPYLATLLLLRRRLGLDRLIRSLRRRSGAPSSPAVAQDADDRASESPQTLPTRH